jgi:hypothetical protein
VHIDIGGRLSVQGLKILKASLQSKTVFTDVFFARKK